MIHPQELLLIILSAVTSVSVMIIGYFLNKLIVNVESTMSKVMDIEKRYVRLDSNFDNMKQYFNSILDTKVQNIKDNLEDVKRDINELKVLKETRRKSNAKASSEHQ